MKTNLLISFLFAMLQLGAQNVSVSKALLKQADRTLKEGDIEVWSRPLADGAIAVGIFNVGDNDRQVDMKSLIPQPSSIVNYQLSIVNSSPTVRDLWRQKDLSESELSCTIPAHGCRYLKVLVSGE